MQLLQKYGGNRCFGNCKSPINNCQKTAVKPCSGCPKKPNHDQAILRMILPHISKLEFRNIVLEMGIVNQSFNYAFTTSTAKMPDSMFIKDCMQNIHCCQKK